MRPISFIRLEKPELLFLLEMSKPLVDSIRSSSLGGFFGCSWTKR
jgi:hypothetical protein